MHVVHGRDDGERKAPRCQPRCSATKRPSDTNNQRIDSPTNATMYVSPCGEVDTDTVAA
jgi:hypothetical protein